MFNIIYFRQGPADRQRRIIKSLIFLSLRPAASCRRPPERGRMQEETGKEECISCFFVKLSVVAFDTNYSGRVLVGKFSDESFLSFFVVERFGA